MVVEPGQNRDGDNATGPLNCPAQRRVFAQGRVRPDLIVIRRIRRKNLPQVSLAEDQHPVQHSRRTVPIRRPTYAFCHGDPGEIGRSQMPMALTRDLKVCP